MEKVQGFEKLASQVPAREITDLVYEVNNALSEAGHPNPAAWHSYVQSDVFGNADPFVQRFLINRAFRLILAEAQENTMNVRFCLVDNGELIDWLRLFKDQVIPCVQRNSLLLN